MILPRPQGIGAMEMFVIVPHIRRSSDGMLAQWHRPTREFFAFEHELENPQYTGIPAGRAGCRSAGADCVNLVPAFGGGT